MKVLLINPLDIQEEKEGTVFFQQFEKLKRIRVLPPLGIAYIAAYLRREGIEVALLDANALRMSLNDVKAYITKLKPDIVGITATTPVFRPAFIICQMVKEINSKIFTVMGGVHVTVLPRETLYHKEIDFGITGEGELSMLNLIERLDRGKDYSDVSGLVFRRNGKVFHNPANEQINNLDTIPFPARDLLPTERYYDATTRHYHAMSMITSRGCPFNCIFCERDIRGGHFRARSYQNVVDEMEEIVKKYGFKEVLLYDDTFTVNKKRVQQICEEILRRGLRFSWDCRSRVDCVSPELLRLMKKAGCNRISYGIESATPEILKILNKKITIEDSINAIRWTKEAGIQVLAYFMLGSPGETKDMIQSTLEFSRKLKPDFAYYSITVGYPGSDLYDMALKNGVVSHDYWERYVHNGGVLPGPLPYFVNSDISRKYLDKMQKKAYYRFYLRPSYLLSRLKYTRSFRDLKWHIRMAQNLFLGQ